MRVCKRCPWVGIGMSELARVVTKSLSGGVAPTAPRRLRRLRLHGGPPERQGNDRPSQKQRHKTHVGHACTAAAVPPVSGSGGSVRRGAFRRPASPVRHPSDQDAPRGDGTKQRCGASRDHSRYGFRRGAGAIIRCRGCRRRAGVEISQPTTFACCRAGRNRVCVAESCGCAGIGCADGFSFVCLDLCGCCPDASLTGGGCRV